MLVRIINVVGDWDRNRALTAKTAKPGFLRGTQVRQMDFDKSSNELTTFNT
tara:strand:+ start:2624 stop:2776 length:153 start_codon:yes stop_codon:yes gene_type:complete